MLEAVEREAGYETGRKQLRTSRPSSNRYLETLHRVISILEDILNMFTAAKQILNVTAEVIIIVM